MLLLTNRVIGHLDILDVDTICKYTNTFQNLIQKCNHMDINISNKQ